MRFNLKHTGAILFALVFLVGGFFISNVAMAEGTVIDEASLLSAISTAQSGDTIILDSDIDITSQLNINKVITIDGAGHKIINNNDFGTNNSSKHLVDVFSGTTDTPVVFSNITFDSNSKSYGLQAYNNAYLTLNNVIIENSKGAGLTVNGSTVSATNLNTNGNSWGAVNVDPGSGVTTPSVFTLNSGALSESNQIWSDGGHVDSTATVTVTASGYTKYSNIEQGPLFFLWANALNNGVTITNGDIHTYYSTIQNALNAASSSDTIVFNSNIALSSQLTINKSVTIDGANHTLTTSLIGGSVMDITANDVTVKNLIEDGGGTAGNNRGINIYRVTGVLLDNVTASNNAKNGIVVNGSTAIVNNVTTKNNGWEGMNVDKGTLSSLTINGVSSHTETKAAIRIDDTSTGAYTVTDTNHQYSHVDTGNARDYFLLETGQTVPDENGTATVTDKNKDVVVTSSSQPLTIDLGSVTDATIDVGSLVTVVGETKTGTIPQTTITSNIADVEIPSTTITSSDKNWDGTINLPKIITTTVQPVADSGNTATVVASIEVGFGDTHLTFNDPVKLTFAGQAGSSIGWSQNGTFHSITNTCDSSTNPTLGADSDCKINVGNDLVVWTKHFTTFTTYTQTINQPSRSSGGSYIMPFRAQAVTPVIAKATDVAPVGQVLGAEKYNFTKVMKSNSKGNEVIELQKFLTSLGYTLSTDGKFGPKTKAAVIKFQKANGLKGDGVIGPLTRAVLNK